MPELDVNALSEAQRRELGIMLAKLTKTERELAVQEACDRAKDDLVTFAQLMMPDPNDDGNPDASLYLPAKHHQTLAAALQEVEAGRFLRFLTTIPPRHGKSTLCSQMLPPWFVGRDPYRHVIFSTYSQTLAEDFGRKVRDIMRSPMYRRIFPRAALKVDSQSVSRLETVAGGVLMFVGRGGSLTGRGADLLVIDDPLKDREEADSTLIRNKLWEWYTQTAYSRLMTASGRVVIVQTRWHEDDLVGRLTDPTNPVFNPTIGKGFKKLDLPAIARDNDPMGRKEGEALWPERFDIESLKMSREQDARGFSALYQGEPTPDTGYFFEADHIATYLPHELPEALTIYAASDHAVSTAQTADLTCLLLAGVDKASNIYVLDELFWTRAATEETVERMLSMMDKYKPMVWWAEKGHISQSIGPFLRKRMQERSIYCVVDEVTPTKDKQSRAQGIRARMASGKVRFPARALWWHQARSQLLKFPFSRHDDFVDSLAHLGMGLDRQHGAQPTRNLQIKEHRSGTIGWFKQQMDYEKTQRRSAGEPTSGDGF